MDNKKTFKKINPLDPTYIIGFALITILSLIAVYIAIFPLAKNIHAADLLAESMQKRTYQDDLTDGAYPALGCDEIIALGTFSKSVKQTSSASSSATVSTLYGECNILLDNNTDITYYDVTINFSACNRTSMYYRLGSTNTCQNVTFESSSYLGTLTIPVLRPGDHLTFFYYMSSKDKWNQYYHSNVDFDGFGVVNYWYLVDEPSGPVEPDDPVDPVGPGGEQSAIEYFGNQILAVNDHISSLLQQLPDNIKHKDYTKQLDYISEQLNDMYQEILKKEESESVSENSIDYSERLDDLKEVLEEIRDKEVKPGSVSSNSISENSIMDTPLSDYDLTDSLLVIMLILILLMFAVLLLHLFI